MLIEIEDFLLDCEAKGLTKKTLKSYRNNTLFFLNYCNEEFGIEKVSRIKSVHVKKFISEKLENEQSTRYVNTIIKTLRSFFKFCEEEEYVVNNIIDKVSNVKDTKKVIETFNEEEVKKMLEVYKHDNYLNSRNRCILATFFDTGIRNTECCNIQNDHIQDDRIYIYGKGKKERFASMSIKLKKEMKKYDKWKKIYFMGKELEYNNYFLSRTGRPLTVEAMERIFTIAGKKANVRKQIRCSPHTARHFWACQMLKFNNIMTISKLLGHSDLKVTQIYLQSLSQDEIIKDGGINSPLVTLNKKGGRK
ncbi:tyrosine-type recombinase/integrase [Inediibacterium massiliense]|uniref:tyrosine-type recombinase/integrase n=1 Tax=Inediibacterium massiliense TaxID=1658111 RepID=UPI0006B60303|nr:tyrosine-type recombinase/integrase [Inediibacterium massiliense]